MSAEAAFATEGEATLLTLGERLLGGFALLLTLGVLLYAGYTLNREHQQSAFDSEANALLREFDGFIDELDTLMATLAGLHQADSGADDLASELRSQNPAITSVGRYASVDGERRAEFERGILDSGLYEFHITELDGDGHAQSRAMASHYYPISQLVPMQPERLRLLGADLGAIDGLGKQLERLAASSDSLVTTLPAHWPTADDLLLLRPTYRGKRAPPNLVERLRQSDGGYWLTADPAILLAGLGERLTRFDATLHVADTGGENRSLFSKKSEDTSTHVLQVLHPHRALEWRRAFGSGEIVLSLSGHTGVPPGFLVGFVTIAVLILFTSYVVTGSVRRARLARRERQRSAQRLHQERERADRTLNAIDDAVFALDLETRILHVNPAAIRLADDARLSVLQRPLDAVLVLRLEGTGEALDLGAALAAVDDGGPREIDVVLDPAAAVEETSVAGKTDVRPPVLRLTMSRTCDTDGQVSGHIIVLRDISDERRLTRRLEYQANHDMLTGCTNRRWFEKRLGELLEDLSMSGKRHALCYLDLDQFKIINDTNGHAAGDRLLQELTVDLQSLCRDGEMLSRLGGDEFGLLLIDVDEEEARHAAERVYDFFQTYVFRHGDDAFAVRACIGLVPLDERSGTIGNVLATADLACYAAKEAGRNELYVYTPDDEAIAQRSNELNRLPELQRALAEDRFELHVQAVASLNGSAPTLEVTHFEFLLRLTGEDGAPISPVRIIEVAERYGLMRQIDRWVISRALASVAELDDGPGRHCSFSINLSGQSAADPTLIDFIESEYARHTIDPSRIWFELTETAAISHFSVAVDLANRIRELGSKVALDDFGSGLSSFGYLKNIPVDVLKIDGQFVRDIARDPVDRTMVRAIHEVAKSMGIVTVAEFVEDQAIVDELMHIGIDYAQGYLIAKPCPMSEALAALASPLHLAA